MIHRTTHQEHLWPLVSTLRVSPHNCEKNSSHGISTFPSSLTTASGKIPDQCEQSPIISSAWLFLHARITGALGGFAITMCGYGGEVQALFFALAPAGGHDYLNITSHALSQQILSSLLPNFPTCLPSFFSDGSNCSYESISPTFSPTPLLAC